MKWVEVIFWAALIATLAVVSATGNKTLALIWLGTWAAIGGIWALALFVRAALRGAGRAKR